MAAGGAGLEAGSVFAGRITRRVGVGPTILLGALIASTSDLVLPLAAGALAVIVVLLIGSHFMSGLGLTLFNVSQLSVRQAVTAEHIQGRMNAAFRVAVVGSVPLGALAGGFIAESIGLRLALFVAVAGEMTAVLWLLAPRLRRLRELPD